MADREIRIRVVVDEKGSISRLDRSMRGAQGSAKGLAGSLRGVSAVIGAIAASQVARTIINIGRAAVDAALQVEALNQKLVQAAGSAAGAATEMDFVRSTVDELGLDLVATAGGFAKFSVALKGTSLEGQTARDIFTAVSKASAVMRLSAEQTGGVFTALEQIVSKGTVSAEELRGQLGERLPGAFRFAAEAMGVTTEELGKLLQAGELTAEDLLPRLAKRLEEEFGASAVEAANSSQAAFNRFNNTVFELRAALGEQLLPIVTSFVDELNRFARSDDAKQVLADLTDISRELVPLFSALVRIGLAAELQKITTVLKTLVFIIDTASPQLKLLVAVMDRFDAAAKDATESTSDWDLRGLLRDANNARGPIAGFTNEITVTTSALEDLGEETVKTARQLDRELAQAMIRFNDLVEEQEQIIRDDLAAMNELTDAGKLLKDALDDIEIPDAADLFGIPPAETQEQAKRRQEEYNEKLRETGEAWANIASAAAEAFRGIDNDIANALNSLSQLISAAVNLERAVKNAGGGFASLATAFTGGAAVGAQTAGLFQQFGIFKGPQGTTQFGGRGEGDFSSEGGAIGGAIGAVVGSIIPVIGTAVGAAIGSVLGTVIGGAIKRGADEGLAQLSLVAGEVSTNILKSEAGLGEVIGGVGDDIGDVVEGIVGALGGTLSSIPDVQLKVRGDEIISRIDGVRFVFKDIGEAVDVLSREILKTAEIAGDVDQAFREILTSGTAEGAEELGAQISAIEQAINAEKIFIDGLSEIEIALQSSSNQAVQATKRFQDMGLSLAQSIRLAGAQTVAFFAQTRQAITGEQVSVEQRKATQRAQAELFNAQFELEIARLEAEREALIAQREIGVGRIEIDRARLQAEQQFTKQQGAIFNAALKVQGGFLQASAGIVNAGASTLEKQIQAIDAVLAALRKIGLIDIPSLRLPNLGRVSGNIGNVGRNLGNLGDAAGDAARELERTVERLRSSIETLRQFRTGLLLRPEAPLPVGRQLLLAQREFARQSRIAGRTGEVGDFTQAADALLQLARGTFGTTAGFQSIFRDVIRATESLEEKFGQQIEDLLAPPEEQTAQNTAKIAEEAEKGRKATERTAREVENVKRATEEADRRNQVSIGKIEFEQRKTREGLLEGTAAQTRELVKAIERIVA